MSVKKEGNEANGLATPMRHSCASLWGLSPCTRKNGGGWIGSLIGCSRCHLAPVATGAVRKPNTTRPRSANRVQPLRVGPGTLYIWHAGTAVPGEPVDASILEMMRQQEMKMEQDGVVERVNTRHSLWQMHSLRKNTSTGTALHQTTTIADLPQFLRNPTRSRRSLSNQWLYLTVKAALMIWDGTTSGFTTNWSPSLESSIRFYIPPRRHLVIFRRVLSTLGAKSGFRHQRLTRVSTA